MGQNSTEAEGQVHRCLPRTDNNIKNHFYSTLRKGIRVLNKVISEISDKGQMKEFKGPILSKLITVAEDKFDRKLTVSD